MTVDAPAGAHAGVAPRDSDVSGDDTYETARTFESLGVSPELTSARWPMKASSARFPFRP